jgi:hypothetical protein
MRTSRSRSAVAVAVGVLIAGHLSAEDPIELPTGRSHIEDAVAIDPLPSWYSDADVDLRNKLQYRTCDVNLDAVTFEHAIDYLRDVSGINVLVNWTAMENAAVEREKEITIRLQSVPVERLLWSILDEVGGGETELAYEIADGVLQISTKEDLSRRTICNVYCVRDLIEWARESNRLGLSFDEDEDPLEKLIYLIQETVDPESWRLAGGNVGAINTFADCLIIVQTSAAHEEIWKLLTEFRRVRSAQRSRR